jgi:hypothetical protein
MARRDDIPKTDPSEIEALIQRLKHSNIKRLQLYSAASRNGKDSGDHAYCGLGSRCQRDRRRRASQFANHFDQRRMLVQPTQPEVFASRPEPAARRLGDTVAHLQEETQQRARLAHQALDEFVREKVGPNGRNELSSADTLSNLEPADAQKLRALQDYAPKRGKSFIADSNRRTDCDASLKNLAAMKRSGEICRQNHVCRNN